MCPAEMYEAEEGGEGGVEDCAVAGGGGAAEDVAGPADRGRAHTVIEDADGREAVDGEAAGVGAGGAGARGR